MGFISQQENCKSEKRTIQFYQSRSTKFQSYSSNAKPEKVSFTLSVCQVSGATDNVANPKIAMKTLIQVRSNEKQGTMSRRLANVVIEQSAHCLHRSDEMRNVNKHPLVFNPEHIARKFS
jgi:hypothetical protein